MHEDPVRDVQEPYSPHNTPMAPERNGLAAGTSNDKGKSTAENLPFSAADDDELNANSDLMSAWMQRLQVLTVVTAFLATMDGELFSLTALNTQIGVQMSRTVRELVYACLSGALVLHICATILGYLTSFALIRYRIVDASGEDDSKVGSTLFFGLSAAQPVQRLPRRIVLETVHPLRWLMPSTFLQRPGRFRFLSLSRRPNPLSSPPPFTLLSRCYHTTLCLTAAGFVLAVTGILAYAWAGLRMAVGIFSTVCLGVGVSASVWAIAM